MDSLTISRKLSATVAVIIFMFAAGGGLGLWGLRLSRPQNEAAYAANDLALTLLRGETDHLAWMQEVGRSLSDPEVHTIPTKPDAESCDFGRWLGGPERAEAETLAPGIGGVFTRLEAAHVDLHAFAASLGQTLGSGSGGRELATANFREGGYARLASLRKLFDEARGLVSARGDLARAEAADREDNMVFFMVFGTLGAIILVAVAGWFFFRPLVPAIERTVQAARGIAEGDFDQDLDVDRHDELGDLARAFSRMADAVRSEIAEKTAGSREMAELLNNIPVPVVSIDPDFNVQGTNPAGAKVAGMTMDECVGKKCYDLFPTPHCRTSECRVAQAMARDEVRIADTTLDLPTGQIPVRYTGAPVKDASGRIVGGLEYITDLSLELQVTEGVRSLVKAALAGDLETRADTSPFRGNYRDIVDGVNQTLDAFTAPTQAAFQVLGQAAEGDLTTRMEGKWGGAYGEIQANVNRLLENMDRGLGQVSVSADQVASAAEQISSGSQSLAQGTSEQASTLEEVASSLQDLSSMSSQSASNAQEAQALTDGARVGTGEGVNSMNRLSEAMERIKTSSDQTARIVKTIDEIAFQTNLLALNAAVEAARAGDAGRGFAVVAEEVRNLALRSAEAAKTTAELIQESVSNAEGGVALNLEVMEALRGVQTQVDQVSGGMDEIAAGAHRQSQGVDQINTAIEQMNQLTQTTAANAEESSSASEELTAQAAELKSLVRSYKISGASSESTRKQPGSAPGRVASSPDFGGLRGAGRKPNGKGTEMGNLPPFAADDGDAVLREF